MASTESLAAPRCRARPLLALLAAQACSSGEPARDAGSGGAPDAMDAPQALDTSPDGVTGDREDALAEDRSEPDDAAPPREAVAPCALSGVRTVVVPAVYGAVGPRLRLAYRVFEPTTPARATVVVLPGGPGQALMEQAPSDPDSLGAVPTSGVRVVYLDTRGSGCNRYRESDGDPAALYRAEWAARDVLSVVRAEGWRDYTLYGASFGTVTATVAAALAGEMAVAPPRAVVLEGVVGRGRGGFDAYFAPYAAEWERVRPGLPPPWPAELGREPFPDPSGYDRDQWGAFVFAQLILGEVPPQGHILGYYLRGLTARTPGVVAYVSRFMAGARAPVVSPMFRAIACRELFGGWRSGRRIERGALVATGDDVCASLPPSHARPYDSAAFVIPSRTYYFLGAHDPATPLAEGRYHFDHQRAPRELVTVPDASHGPLTYGLRGHGCASAVWEAILAGSSVAPPLRSCAPGSAGVTAEAAPAAAGG
ncbi:MAG: hypothetical protein HY909_09645 [Deltaproteobacteria bacterium]|nr:hypothetical protein [Deltaproteobacteria bacterium]